MNQEPSEVAALALSVTDLRVSYRSRSRIITALDGVTLNVLSGSILGITGASGGGKSTLARCLAGWELPSSGLIQRSLPVQLVMQDAGASLNPRFTALEALEEPCRIRRLKPVLPPAALMELVGLNNSHLRKRTAEFSGGERTRLAVARALAALRASRGVLILDESFSGLDAPLQRQIEDLLRELKSTLELTFVLISHDIASLIRFVSEIVVFFQGRIVEQAPAADIVRSPSSQHAKDLLDAALETFR